MCFLSEEYLRVCDEEFRKTVELGADGILFDECLHHGPALLCFDASHGHRYGAPVYANDRKLIQNFAEDRGPVGPGLPLRRRGLLRLGDGGLPALLSPQREQGAHPAQPLHAARTRQFMTAVTGFNDRNMINQCLLYRYIISYEPYNFKGRLDDYPATMAYGKQMDALRTELREYFWDGEFRHESAPASPSRASPTIPTPSSAPRTAGGPRHRQLRDDATITVEALLASGQPLTRYRLVDDPTWRPVAEGIVIPPRSAAVVI